MPIEPTIQAVYDNVQLLDVDEVMRDTGVVNQSGQAAEQIRQNIERQVDLVENRLCCLCEREVENSNAQIILVQTNGISGLFCGGTCLLEFHAMTWLQDEFDGIVDGIKMRNQVPLQPQEEDPLDAEAEAEEER